MSESFRITSEGLLEYLKTLNTDAEGQIQEIGDVAYEAINQVTVAKDAATSAEGYARNAEGYANEARDSAAEANKQASDATQYAKDARDMADTAATEAKRAADEADAASESADKAAAAAEVASTSAKTAAQEAEKATNESKRATTYANSALTQLSIVEEVLDTLEWIDEHGEFNLTKDTEIDTNKVYFIEQDGTYYPVGEPKTEDLSTYYELTVDTAMSNYVASHLALTDSGLYVLKDKDAYKLLVANDGVHVQDSAGNDVAVYGQSIRFGDTIPQYIGGNNAYIVFDGNNLNIGGANVTFNGSQTLDEVLNGEYDLNLFVNGGINVWIDDENIDIDREQFLSNFDFEAADELKDEYVFVKSGTNWQMDGDAVSLTDYGIEISDDGASITTFTVRAQTLTGLRTDTAGTIADISSLFKYTASNDALVDTLGTNVTEIAQKQAQTDTNYTDLTGRVTTAEGTLSQITPEITKLTGQIKVYPSVPLIDIISGKASVSITSSQVQFKSNGSVKAYAGTNAFVAPSLQASEVLMRVRDKQGTLLGGGGFIMRQNGHMSLKKITGGE